MSIIDIQEYSHYRTTTHDEGPAEVVKFYSEALSRPIDLEYWTRIRDHFSAVEAWMLEPKEPEQVSMELSTPKSRRRKVKA